MLMLQTGNIEVNFKKYKSKSYEWNWDHAPLSDYRQRKAICGRLSFK